MSRAAEHPEWATDAEPTPGVGRLVADVEGEAFAREAPPAGLWSRIEAALAADADHVRGSNGAIGSGGVVEYRIDAHDFVVSTGAGWAEFAEANEAPELGMALPECTLWDCIGDDSLRDLWRSTVAVVRASGRSSTLPFRCDGPTARRWFEMTVTPEPDGGVTFRSELTFQMPRSELVALGRHRPCDNSAAAVQVCSWCAEANDGGEWRPIEEVLMHVRLLEADPAPPIRHGICERCAAVMSDRLHVGTEAQPAPRS